MLKIGLTGGIGSGKTTIAELFADFGTPIIDADDIAHQLTRPHQPALSKIQEQFGDCVITTDGSLNRSQLKQLIFANPVYKKKLEAILHPLIFAEISHQITELNADYVILSIPLLLETGQYDFVDRILVVDVPVEVQIERVNARDLLSNATIQAIIDSQISRAQKLKAADDIIDNSGAPMLLAEQVKKLHNYYLSLSQLPKG